MADQTTESILFEIKINSEQYKSEQKLIRDSLGQLALDIEKTKSAQKLLNKERDLGKLSDAEYARQSVKLREELRGQQADQRELEKGLAMSQKAYNASAGSAEQLRAQLFELTTAYYAMGEAERKAAEGQAVQKQALAVSDALKSIEGNVGSTGRNVGNYAASFKQGLAPIVAELAKVEAAIKGVDLTSEEGAILQQKRIGFMTAAQRAAAPAGITDFTQAKATIDQYTQAFTPAVENLVRIQQEQQQVGQTVGENSEQYQQLGFRVAGAQKALDDLVAKAAKPILPPEPINTAAGSLAALRQQLIELKNTRETLDPTTQEAQDLNAEILELDTRIQQAAGKIDEFGERVQKNIKKENFDTVTDAVQGMVGAFSVATLVLGDNTDAAAAQARALQLMAIAQNARAIAIGIDSAKDAAQIVLLKAKSLFIKEEAVLTAAAAVSTEAHAAVATVDAAAIEGQAGAAALNAGAQAESAAATAGSTVATEAQVVR
jgi:chromosome segregation ATPase